MKLKKIWADFVAPLRDTGLITENKKLPEAIIKWRATEFYLVDKSIVWGIILIIVLLSLAAFMILIGQFLASLVCIVFMVVTLKFAYAKPEIVEYRIEEKGFRISGWLHPYYKDIVAFWTASYKGKHTLYLQTTNILINYLAIPTGDEPLKKIVKALEKFLPESSPAQAPKVKKA